MFFFGGVQLFFMGMIGEYVLAIYGQVREKPVVFERERVNFDGPPPSIDRRNVSALIERVGQRLLDPRDDCLTDRPAASSSASRDPAPTFLPPCSGMPMPDDRRPLRCRRRMRLRPG